MLRFLVGLLFCLGFSLLGEARATDFRIETKVYTEDEEVPLSQNTTLIQSGVVYDFLESTGRVAIFRRGSGEAPGRFLLIDPARNVKTEITTDRIDAAIEKLGKWSLQQRNPLLRFAGEPTFAETFDEETGKLELASKQMTYTVATVEVERTEVWRDLRNYLDEYAKLNCILSSSMPPLPRLKVNQALEAHNVAPVEVNLSITGNQQTNLRAEHLFTWRLSKDDRARIALVGEQLVNFRSVSNAEFRDDTVAANE